MHKIAGISYDLHKVCSIQNTKQKCNLGFHFILTQKILHVTPTDKNLGYLKPLDSHLIHPVWAQWRMLWTPSMESTMATCLHSTRAVERRWMLLQVYTGFWSKGSRYSNRCSSPFCRNCTNISAARRHSKINGSIKLLQRTFTQNWCWKLVSTAQ